MSDSRGAAFLLKARTVGTEDQYTTLAGLRAERVRIVGDQVLASYQGSAWRELADAAARSVDVEASGIFVGSAAEKQARNATLGGAILPYELSFESGERLRGAFQIVELEYRGDFNGERNYKIVLASSGDVVAI
jgi:predicted secreted protein